jgi:hypothetical protein
MKLSKLINPIWISLFCLLCTVPGWAQRRGGMGSGGGNFTIPVFWQRVEEGLVPALHKYKTGERKLLGHQQIDKLLSLMKREIVKVELTNEQLFLERDSKKIPVDALNYPSKKLIQLHKPIWQSKIDQGFSIDHLILHEFMGLAGIPDVDSSVSAKIIPPVRSPIAFESDKLKCTTVLKYVFVSDRHTRNKKMSWHVRDTAESDEFIVQLSPATKLNQKPKCHLKDEKTNTCVQYAEDYKIKTAEFQLPLEFYYPRHVEFMNDETDITDGEYFIEGSVHLISSYYGYGWGAAASTLFLRQPQLQMVWKLVHYDTKKNLRRILSQVSQETFETDEFRNTASLAVEFPVSTFTELLEKNGFRLSLIPSGGEVHRMFHSDNIVEFLTQTALSSGAKTQEEVDDFVMNKVLKGMPKNSLPFRAHGFCTLVAE